MAFSVLTLTYHQFIQPAGLGPASERSQRVGLVLVFKHMHMLCSGGWELPHFLRAIVLQQNINACNQSDSHNTGATSSLADFKMGSLCCSLHFIGSMVQDISGQAIEHVNQGYPQNQSRCIHTAALVTGRSKPRRSSSPCSGCLLCQSLGIACVDDTGSRSCLTLDVCYCGPPTLSGESELPGCNVRAPPATFADEQNWRGLRVRHTLLRLIKRDRNLATFWRRAKPIRRS